MRKLFLLPVFALVFLATTVAPSMAAPAERFPISDFSFQRVNDCTGNFTTWTQSNQFMRVQGDPNLVDHFTFTITGDVSTADGFTGQFSASLALNLQEPVPDPVGEQTIAITYTLHDASGSALLTHEVVHIVFLPSGESTGSVLYLESRCLGKLS
jgi:hypothetical protein